MSLLESQRMQRLATRKECRKVCVGTVEGVTEFQRKSMYSMFIDGHFSIGDVAKAVGVSYMTAKRCVESDDELYEQWQSALQNNLDKVESAMFTRAIEGRNEIAAQQAGEFILSHKRKTDYGEEPVSADMLKALPKIIIAPVVSRSPLQPQAIDVTPQ